MVKLAQVSHIKDESSKKRLMGEIERKNELRMEFQRNLVKVQAWQCCLNCEEWSDGKGTFPQGCMLHKALPPPEVIMVGCIDHMVDIPF